MRLFLLGVHATCLLCLILVSGCDRPSSAVVRIVLEFPDASSVTMDELVAFPLLNAISGAPRVANIESLSFAGRTQLFVSVERTDSIDLVAQRVRAALASLPPGCQLLALDQLPTGEDIPAPELGEVEQLDVLAKPDDVLAGLGVSPTAARKAIRQALANRRPTDDLDGFKKLPVSLDGRSFQLADVAEIQLVKTPKCIARDLTGRR